MFRDRLPSLLDGYQPGYSLPQEFYVGEDIFKADLAGIFEREWLFACNACEIKKPGDYLTLEIGANSIIVLRDPDGEITRVPQYLPASRIAHLLKETGHATRTRLSVSSMGL